MSTLDQNSPYRAGLAFFLILASAHLAILGSPSVRAQGIRHQMMLEEAKTGDKDAQYALGLSYASGFGVEENAAEAAKWYLKAAEQGMAAAQKNLAQLLASGKGIQRNFVEAYKWYEISIPNLPDGLGRDVLRVGRDALAKKMPAAQVAAARKLAVSWLKQYSARTGRVLSPIDGYEKDEGASGTKNNWKCDKKRIKGRMPKLWLNPCLLALAPGKWTQIYQEKKGHAVRFRLQSHGGSAFDTRRGRIVLFGSNTHEALRSRNRELINSPLAFDVAKLRWMRFYPSDPLATYTIHRSGIPVAGYAKNHPWAMHTYGSVEYDPKRDELVVSSHPQHLDPERFVDSVAHLWGRIKYHPTWVFSFKTNQWVALRTPSQSFFKYSTAYATDRGTIIGYRDDGVFELGGRHRKWRQIARKGLLGGHSNSVYDSKQKAVVAFGYGYNTGESNAVVAFWPKTKRHRVMPTPGLRPRADTHVPMAYHPKLERTVVIIDDDAYFVSAKIRQHSSAQTWLYDLGKDKWTLQASAPLPLGSGMNYNLVYDPGHNILLLVAQGEKNQTTVWALRL